MNTELLNLAIKSGLVNYVDNETPRHYFISGNADLENVEEFADLVVENILNQIFALPNDE